MKKLLLSLLLLFPFAATKADIINTYTFSFTGHNQAFNPKTGIDDFFDQAVSGSGTYSFDLTTNKASDFSLTVDGASFGSGTYSYKNLNTAQSNNDSFRLLVSGRGAVYYGGSPTYGYAASWSGTGGFGFTSDSWTTSSVTTTEGTPQFTPSSTVFSPIIAPVPEPSSWVLGLGGLMGMTVLASRKKKSTASILKGPAFAA